MNLVEQIARKIDREGAYAEAYDGTGPEAKPIPFTTRQKYWQAEYGCLAIELLKDISAFPRDHIKRDLIEWEKQGWRRLNVPIDDPALKDHAHKIIEDKYATV